MQTPTTFYRTKNMQKCKVNCGNFTDDGLTFIFSSLVVE